MGTLVGSRAQLARSFGQLPKGVRSGLRPLVWWLGVWVALYSKVLWYWWFCGILWVVFFESCIVS